MAFHYKDFRRRNFSPEKYVDNCLFLSVIVNKIEVLFYKTAGEVLSEISLQLRHQYNVFNFSFTSHSFLPLTSALFLDPDCHGVVFVSGTELIFFTVVSTGYVFGLCWKYCSCCRSWKAAAQLGLPRVRAFPASLPTGSGLGVHEKLRGGTARTANPH